MKLIEAAEVNRNADGSWYHPELPDFEEGQEKEMAEWVASQGLTISRGMLEDLPLEDPLYVAYFDEGDYSFLEWRDEPPPGEGWFTLGIWDTEDGPVWTWGRRTAPADSQGKEA